MTNMQKKLFNENLQKKIWNFFKNGLAQALLKSTMTKLRKMDFSIFSKYVDIVKIGWSWAKNLLLFSTETSIFCLLLIFMILTFFNSVFQDGIFGTHLTVHSSSILVHCRTSQDKQYSTSTDYMRQNGTGPKWMIPF